MSAFATWAKGKGRMICWDPACRGDNGDAAMTPAEEGRKGHVSNFPQPEIQTLGLVADGGGGIKDADYCGDFLSRFESRLRAKGRTEGAWLAFLRKASLG